MKVAVEGKKEGTLFLNELILVYALYQAGKYPDSLHMSVGDAFGVRTASVSGLDMRHCLE
jgi:hypothetical protein